MKTLRWIFISTVGIVFLTGPIYAQIQKASEAEVVTVPVTDKIYMLEGPEGNTSLSIGNDGVLIADDQFLSEGIQRAIKKIKDIPVKIRINTDGTSSQILQKAQGAVIVHDGIREVLSLDEAADFFAKKETSSEHVTLVTFGQNTSLRFNDEEIRIMVFLSENPLADNMIYFVQSNVLYMGDNFFSGMFPALDADRGGDVEKYTDNISMLLESLPENIKIIPGHGPLSTKDDLEDFKRMLIETTAVVRSKINESKDFSTIQQEGLGEQWMSWGKGPISSGQWISIVYNSLNKNNAK